MEDNINYEGNEAEEQRVAGQEDTTADAERQEETAETSGENEVNFTTKEEELQDVLDKTNEQLAELKDKYLRLSADFDNYRKRTLKEKSELILNGGEKTLCSILPVVDDFERALKTLQTATDVEAVREGVTLIYNKFMSTLAQNGVKPIEAKDKPLDTDFHEAIAVVPAPTEELKGCVIDCVQTGYTMNDKVIRHAKVVVGQ